MAYIGMPLLFSLIIDLILVMLATPLLQTATPMLRLFFSDSAATSLAGALTDAEDTLTEFYTGPVGASGETVDGSLVKIPTYEALYGEILCERIGMQSDLYYGETTSTLKKGVAQSIKSLLPGFGQPTLISGHNNRAFQLLQYLEEGDVIVIHTSYGTYEYQVTGFEIMNADDFDMSSLGEEADRLILYTCYPFDTLGLTSRRYFVYAEQISGPKVVFSS